ncbi:O-methyltransferase [Marinibacterium profundimaris]|uniref:Methyltransferase n=1 Tax=Marinibacterium profundimaris TaxID=1679460 RepID=A0A225NHQ3_9RHOB|nr:class I SAM-dependent methyltransferase [Marinibacterium profundimaris]OWU70543.1 hypothetical protein ATO3_19975 [Marinibacterium profundimaris]
MWLPRDPAIAAELSRLHAASRASDEAREARGGFLPEEDTDDIVRLGSEYLAVSPEEGRLLYMLARGAQARRVVEFGASFGLSTLYLAAALRETGGQLFTTEVHPEKCRALRESFDRAGVGDIVTLLEGDARETLITVEGPLDMVLLDGWKSMYLPVLHLLSPRLRAGALVAADNIRLDASQPYLAHVSDPASGFLTRELDDMALSLKLD